MTYTEQFLPFMIRIILGVLFFFQSYDIIFRIGMKNTCDTVSEGCRKKKIPDWFSKFSVISSTYVQLIGGLLLMLGLFTPITMLMLGINLILVTIGFSFLQGIWDMQHVFPRLVLLIALFLIPADWDLWSIDNLLEIKLR